MTMQLVHYLGRLHRSSDELARAFDEVAAGHGAEIDVEHICRILAGQCRDHSARLAPFLDRYGEEAADEPERLHADLFGDGARGGALGLMLDLHDLYLMTCDCSMSWTMVGQAAQGVRDDGLLDVVQACEEETLMQMRWLRTRLKQAAPQTLVVV